MKDERARNDARGDRELGLCPSCRHVRAIVTERSRFWLCTRARTDPRYRKYPPQPVVACPGWER